MPEAFVPFPHVRRNLQLDFLQLFPLQISPQQRADVLVQAVRKDLQAELHAVDAPPHPLGHAAVPVPVLRKEVPPEVRHEEAHLHPHGSVAFPLFQRPRAEIKLNSAWPKTKSRNS